jgi:hypothetical protein
MANMSYCAFENTVRDLRDCMDIMRNEEEDGTNSLKEFIETRGSDEEKRAVKRLIDLCREIAEIADNWE